MYRAYFGITEDPFAITPDPRFLYLSGRHREAFAHLLYGVGEGGGFVQLTGEVGTGKTTLCRNLLAQAPVEAEVALILNPRQTPVELVASICDELHIPYPAGSESLKPLIDRLNRHLLESHARGRRTVVIIDEAQNLSREALEQVRLLTNLETATEKLLRIILIGQPELQALLERPELRQLAQRITARYHLTPLSHAETAAYVAHRLEVAGLREPLFTRGALRLVHRLTGGIPRLINVVCGRALLAAYVEQRRRIDRRLLRRAAAEVRGQRARPRPALALVAAGALLLLLVPALWWHEAWQARLSEALPEPAVAREAVAPAPGPPADKRADDGPLVPNAEPLVAEAVAAFSAEGLDGNGPARPGAQVSLAGLLSDDTLPRDGVSAFLTLFRRWGVDLQGLGGTEACTRAALEHLRCLFGRGDWQDLRRYNRPAVIDLVGAAGTRHRVVVTALNSDRVSLDFGVRQVSLALDEVGPAWTGRFVLFWRPPRVERLLRAGSEGPDVTWLRQRLDAIEGVRPGEVVPASAVFDEALAERVRTFQARYGLTPDGVVGRRTLLQLDIVGAPADVPVLRRPVS